MNNRFTDLRHQLELAYEGNSNLINDKLGTKRTIDEIFRNAQKHSTNGIKGTKVSEPLMPC